MRVRLWVCLEGFAFCKVELASSLPEKGPVVVVWGGVPCSLSPPFATSPLRLQKSSVHGFSPPPPPILPARSDDHPGISPPQDFSIEGSIGAHPGCGGEEDLSNT